MKSRLPAFLAPIAMAASIFAAQPQSKANDFESPFAHMAMCQNTPEIQAEHENLDIWAEKLKEKGLDLEALADQIELLNFNDPEQIKEFRSVVEKAVGVEPSELDQAFQWFMKNVPNLEELWLDIRYQIPIDLLLGPWTAQIQNPAGKTGIRTALKTKAVWDKKERKSKIGRTEYVFDEANEFAHYTKLFTMLAVTGAMYYITGDAEVSAIFANYPADWSSRLVTLLGEKRQDHFRNSNHTEPFGEYVIGHFEYADLQAAQNQAIPKTLGSNVWGDVVKFMGAIKGLEKVYWWSLNRFLPYTFECGSNIFSNAQQLRTYHNLPESGWRGRAAYGGSVAGSFVLAAPLAYVASAVNTYAMAPMARMITNSMKRIDDVLDSTGQMALNVIFVGMAGAASWYKIKSSRYQAAQKDTLAQLSRLATSVGKLGVSAATTKLQELMSGFADDEKIEAAAGAVRAAITAIGTSTVEENAG